MDSDISVKLSLLENTSSYLYNANYKSARYGKVRFWSENPCVYSEALMAWPNR